MQNGKQTSIASIFVYLLTFFSLSFTTYPALGYTVDDVRVPESTTLGTSKLFLQGAGMRTKFIIDVYVGAFYASKRINTPSQALADKGPKRMWFYIVHSKIKAEQFRDAWQKGIVNNNSDREIKQEKKFIEQFIDLFDRNFTKGDIVTIDFVPGEGTRVSINSKLRGTIPSEHLYKIVLSTWMGEQPPSQRFQDALLSFNK